MRRKLRKKYGDDNNDTEINEKNKMKQMMKLTVEMRKEKKKEKERRRINKTTKGKGGIKRQKEDINSESAEEGTCRRI